MKLLLLCIGLIVALPARATSIVFPKFGAPIKQGNSVVFTSSDSRRVIAVSFDKKKLWEKSFQERVNLIEGPHHQAWLQQGRDVFRVNPSRGELSHLFVLGGASNVLHFHRAAKVLYTKSSNYATPGFQILDPQSGKILWRNDQNDIRIVAFTDSIIFLRTATLVRERKAYRPEDFYLLALNRTNFSALWEPIPINNYFVPAVAMPPYLALVDGLKLLLIDIESGKTVNTRRTPFAIGEVAAKDGLLVYGTQTYFEGSYDGEFILTFCSLPELAAVKELTLKARSVAELSFWKDYFVTDALYRVTGFNKSGRKLWEKFQLDRSEIMDGKIYFSGLTPDATVTQVGILNVATGRQKILYSEKISQSAPPSATLPE